MKTKILSVQLLFCLFFLLKPCLTFGQCYISSLYAYPTTFCEGDSVYLWTYGDDGTGNPTYQWYIDGSPIPGATQDYYYATASGGYSCALTNPGCWSFPITNTVYLNEILVPVATISANGPTAICAGNPVTLTASSPASSGNQFQWRVNNAIIPGATAANYSASAAGNYDCIISNTCGSDTSGIISVSVLATPASAISSSAPTILCNGGTVVLSTDNNVNYIYAWYRNNSALPGMVLPDYLVSSGGDYYVKVTDTTTNWFRNSGIVPVSIGPLTASVNSSAPLPTVCAGTSVVLTAVINLSTASYQWKKNGNAIPFATSSNYTFNADSNAVYTVEVTSICGTVTSSAYSITIIPGPVATISASSSTGFCSPDSVVLNANTGISLSYQWYLNTINSPINGAVTPTYAAHSTGTYFVKVTDLTTGCQANSNSIATSSTGIVASVTPSGTIHACDSFLLTANTATGFTYQWRRNGINISGATSQSYSVHNLGAGNYDVVMSGSCGNNISNVVNVIIDTNTIAHDITLIFVYPSGCMGLCGGLNLTMCEGQVANIAFNRFFPYGPQVTPTWYLNGSPLQNPVTYLSSSDYDNWVVAGLTQPGYYYCSISNGCGITWSDTNNIIVNPAPVATITANGSTTFCTGGSVTLSATTGTGYTYQWRNNGIPIQGATSSNYIATAPGTYTCFVSNATGCNNVSGFINVSVGMNVPVITANATAICQGNSLLLSTQTGAGFSYQWQLNGTNIPGGIASTYSATVPGNYTCVVTSSCGIGLSDTLTLTVDSIPPANISASGSTSVCSGNSVTLNANTGPGLTYQWKLNGGIIIGATASSYSATAAGNYTCVVSNTCGNATSNSISVTVNTLPTATISTPCSTTICSGNSVTLNANTGTGLTYQWKLNGGTIAGATASSYSATSAGNYTCVVTNSCGSTTSNSINVIVNSAPIATITAGGSTTFCTGGSVILNANTGTGLSYQWELNGGTIAGATSSSYSATSAGSYTCVVTNSCSSTTSNSINVIVNSAPIATITAAGSTSFCNGGSVVLNANSGTGLSYQWKLNGGTIPGATASSYSATSAGSYTCEVSNNCGSVTSNLIVVNVGPAVPATPSPILGIVHPCPGFDSIPYAISSVSGATFYNWTVPSNAVIVSGQGTVTIEVSFLSGFVSGTITVTAGNSCGSSAPRNKPVAKGPQCAHLPVQIFYTRNAGSGGSDNQPDIEVEVFPNPSNNYFSIQVSSPADGNYLFILRDLLGREIERREKITTDEQISFGYNLTNGVYFVEVILGDMKKVVRVIKSE